MLPVFVLFDRGDRYRLLTLPPLCFERAAGPDDLAATAAGMARLLRVMETVVSAHPDQWFNFYDVWPE